MSWQLWPSLVTSSSLKVCRLSSLHNSSKDSWADLPGHSLQHTFLQSHLMLKAYCWTVGTSLPQVWLFWWLGSLVWQPAAQIARILPLVAARQKSYLSGGRIVARNWATRSNQTRPFQEVRSKRLVVDFHLAQSSQACWSQSQQRC